MNGLLLVYPYPWFNQRFYHKDVIQFPKALAEKIGVEFGINQGILITGSEREGQSVLLIRFALLINVFYCIFRLLWNQRWNRNQFYVVQFHISWATALVCLVLSCRFRGRCKIIVKTDLNLCGSLGRRCPSFGEKIASKIIDRTAMAVTGETVAAVKILREYFSRTKILLQYNGVDLKSFQGEQSCPIDGIRDIDVLVVSRFDVPDKGIEYYRVVVPLLLSQKLKIALVGQAASRMLSRCGKTDSKMVIQHDALPHRGVIQMMRRSKLLLNLSVSESYIIALVEAVSVGCFVVTTKVGVAGDLAAQYKNVSICNDDPHATVAEVLNLLGKAGSYHECVNEWSWPKLIEDSGITSLIHNEYCR